jgi:hypothetical protein
VLVITFMQDIHNYIPETNHISSVHIQCCSCSVFTMCATCNVILLMKYVLYCYISTSCSLCAVHNMAVFCSSLILCFRGMLLW